MKDNQVSVTPARPENPFTEVRELKKRIKELEDSGERLSIQSEKDEDKIFLLEQQLNAIREIVDDIELTYLEDNDTTYWRKLWQNEIKKQIKEVLDK